MVAGGIGILGVGPYSRGANKRIHDRWRFMFQRCYEKSFLEKHPSYVGAEVCEAWKNFQTFAYWCERTPFSTDADFDLDKDYRIKGNRVYCPEACSFIPRALNKFLADAKDSLSDTPLGVRQVSNGAYNARCWINGKREFLGYFKSKDDAAEAYRQAKEKEATRLAEYYQSVIHIDVFTTLVNYKAP